MNPFMLARAGKYPGRKHAFISKPFSKPRFSRFVTSTCSTTLYEHEARRSSNFGAHLSHGKAQITTCQKGSRGRKSTQVPVPGSPVGFLPGYLGGDSYPGTHPGTRVVTYA
eukprot:1941065-Rhodomonas_salina.1